MKLPNLNLPPALRAFGFFAVSILLSKGLALISIPLVARSLPPSEYGQIELISSIIEIAGIVMSFGLADSLIRFASSSNEHEQKKVAAGLAGVALLFAICSGVALEVAAHMLIPQFGLEALATPISFGIAAATLSGLIEMPLAWLRLKGNPGLFLAFTVSRSAMQVATMALTLSLGYGVTGLVAGNATIDFLIAAALMALHIKTVGIRLDVETFRRAGVYGLPLVGGALAMFVLGACDRWFLAATLPSAELGFYGLAAKLSFIVPLAMQPFGLWWYAQRIRVLGEPEGLAKSARMIGVGMALLGAGVAITCTLAPVLVETALPAPYRNALPYLPWLALISVLNETCSLVNVGVYAARNSFRVLGVNAAGALVALVGYIALAPAFGVAGAITSTIAGQATRLTLYLHYGRRLAPIDYPWALCAVIVLVDVMLLWFNAGDAAILLRLVGLAVALTIFAGLAFRSFGLKLSSAVRSALA